MWYIIRTANYRNLVLFLHFVWLVPAGCLLLIYNYFMLIIMLLVLK